MHQVDGIIAVYDTLIYPDHMKAKNRLAIKKSVKIVEIVDN